jgi:hypothetical protein
MVKIIRLVPAAVGRESTHLHRSYEDIRRLKRDDDGARLKARMLAR